MLGFHPLITHSLDIGLNAITKNLAGFIEIHLEHLK